MVSIFILEVRLFTVFKVCWIARIPLLKAVDFHQTSNLSIDILYSTLECIQTKNIKVCIPNSMNENLISQELESQSSCFTLSTIKNCRVVHVTSVAYEVSPTW